jgi:hypothetical protein
LDTAFQLSLCTDDDIDVSDLSQIDITELCQQHANELLTDKQFIFGKFHVDQNGVVCKFFCTATTAGVDVHALLLRYSP